MATESASHPSSELLEESRQLTTETTMLPAKRQSPPEPPAKKLYVDLCDVCEQLLSKYKCPNCATLSCSLQCVRQHKEERRCSGKRDKTAFVQVKQFTDAHLTSDYHFLEEVERSVTNGSRIKGQLTSMDPRSRRMARELVYQARKRGINFFHLSHGMEKRAQNTTYFNKEKKAIFWQVKLVFAESDSEVVEERVCEDDTLRSVLAKYIDPFEPRNWILHRLKRYLSSPGQGLLSKVAVLLKAERLKGKEQRFYHMDCSKSIKTILWHKNVVEFPEFRIILKANLDAYNIISAVKHSAKGGGGKSMLKGIMATAGNSEVAVCDRPSLLEKQQQQQQKEKEKEVAGVVVVESGRDLSSGRENGVHLAANVSSPVESSVLSSCPATQGTTPGSGLSSLVPYVDSEPEEGEVSD